MQGKNLSIFEDLDPELASSILQDARLSASDLDEREASKSIRFAPPEAKEAIENAQKTLKENKLKLYNHIDSKIEELHRQLDFSSLLKWLRNKNNQIYLPFYWPRTSQTKALQQAVIELIRKGELNLSTLSYADLEDTDLRRLNLKNANLHGANLKNANLSHAGLDSANLKRANLRKAQLQNADLEDAQLQNADLQEARLDIVDLYDANLEDANLQKASLESTDLEQVFLEGVNLSEAKVGVSQLLACRSLYRVNLTIPDDNHYYKFSSNENDQLFFKPEGFDRRLELTEKTAQEHGVEKKVFTLLVNNVQADPNNPFNQLGKKERGKIINCLSKLRDAKVKELENKVFNDYVKNYIRPPHLVQPNPGKKWTFQLIKLSGFAPLEWGKKPDDLNTRYTLLTNHKGQVCRYILKELKKIQDSYPHDRIWKGGSILEGGGFNKEGGFCKIFYRKPTRKGQLERLEDMIRATEARVNGPAISTDKTYTDVDDDEKETTKQTDTSDKDIFEPLITCLGQIKAEIAAEDNLWQSELLNNINGIFAGCFDEEKLKAASPRDEDEDKDEDKKKGQEPRF